MSAPATTSIRSRTPRACNERMYVFGTQRDSATLRLLCSWSSRSRFLRTSLVPRRTSHAARRTRKRSAGAVVSCLMRTRVDRPPPVLVYTTSVSRLRRLSIVNGRDLRLRPRDSGLGSVRPSRVCVHSSVRISPRADRCTIGAAAFVQRTTTRT
ncbi:hypothetical protein OH76DRAFT_724001 [Lentinus brumalis]|uniref:Uncharacterized protein n=1 Tax=Lentinus brumalis TaxID=2498619 RepID=A0A371D524_9APHY|nr:hypothetical protein OH76DRAFT_724001 [Polyporus brumalis]